MGQKHVGGVSKLTQKVKGSFQNMLYSQTDQGLQAWSYVSEEFLKYAAFHYFIFGPLILFSAVVFFKFSFKNLLEITFFFLIEIPGHCEIWGATFMLPQCAT